MCYIKRRAKSKGGSGWGFRVVAGSFSIQNRCRASQGKKKKKNSSVRNPDALCTVGDLCRGLRSYDSRKSLASEILIRLSAMRPCQRYGGHLSFFFYLLESTMQLFIYIIDI